MFLWQLIHWNLRYRVWRDELNDVQKTLEIVHAMNVLICRRRHHDDLLNSILKPTHGNHKDLNPDGFELKRLKRSQVCFYIRQTVRHEEDVLVAGGIKARSVRNKNKLRTYNRIISISLLIYCYLLGPRAPSLKLQTVCCCFSF